MTTFGYIAAAFDGARAAAKHARAQRRQARTAAMTERTKRAARTFRQGVLQLGALGVFTFAAWSVNQVAGLVALGVSLLVAEWLLSE